MRTKEYDPLRGFFTREWETSFEREEVITDSDFSAAVIKRIADCRKKEWLFNLGCMAGAVACVVAVLLYVFPKELSHLISIDWGGVFVGVFESFRSLFFSVQEKAKVMVEASFLPLRQYEALFLWRLLSYSTLLAGVLFGMDRLIRKVLGYHSAS